MSMSETRRQELLASANKAAGDDPASWPGVAALALDELGQARALLREMAEHPDVVGKYDGPGYVCVYCQHAGPYRGALDYSDVVHDASCPVTRVRTMLGDA